MDNTMHSQNTTTLLELAANDDLTNFNKTIESRGVSIIDEVGHWYTRGIGSNKMGYEERTPLMVAAQYGSINIINYILALENGSFVDVNRVSGSDRVTALHCAVAGGSHSSAAVIHRLIFASANLNILDANGNRASDLIPMLPKVPLKNSSKQIDTLLKPGSIDSDSSSSSGSVVSDCDSDTKKEFAMVDLPDMNNGVYGSDEFRMYSFKIKPCSRAYTHDWTECPFAHPGENARRDPKKYQYTCVPCPEFKKGSCKKGEECEFAHGVFESWLHPAQYKTRLCKDEIGCLRKVCFFAHRREELRPVYASTGSALPDVSSPGGGFSGCTTPPMSPSFAPLSPSNGASGGGGGVYQGKSNFGATPPNLQLPGSRLRSSLSARDVEFEREMIKINQQYQHQHQHQQVLSPRPSPRWNNNNIGRACDMIPATNLDQAFASINVARKLSPPSVMDSPLSAPRKLSPPRALDSPKSVATTMLNSRAAAFVSRSQSFIDRSGSPMGGSNLSSPMSDWGAPNGKLDWGIHGEELNKLRKSNSFAIRGASNNATRTTSPPGFNEPDVSWVNSLIKEEKGAGFLGAKMTNYGRIGARNGVQVSGMHKIEHPYVTLQLRSRNARVLVSSEIMETSSGSKNYVKDRPSVKMCGTPSARDVAIVAEAGADFIGMITWPNSKRSVSLPTPKDFSDVARKHGAESVGNFVDDYGDSILKAADASNIEFVQLHGNGSRRTFPLLAKEEQVIHVLHSDKDGDLLNNISQEECSLVDWIQVDSATGGRY